ncbi:MAG: hypothetical protein HZB36_01070 [Candidatus Omnitrophica bacterium]|nr:hypothetical protein [Candidatus Omnitrophota bacterium]
MSSRNAEKRPVAWKISYNRELAEISKEMGFEVWPFFIGCITSRDNLGRLEGDEYQLKGMFFPDTRYPQVAVEKVRQIRDALVEKGLIIVYVVKDVKYIMLPKIGEYSDIVGNMSPNSVYPDPPADVIKMWEQRMNDVYTPAKSVNTSSKRKSSEVEVEGKVEDKDFKKKRSLEKKKFSTPVFKNDVAELRRKYKNDDALVKRHLTGQGYAEVEIDKALGRF